MKVTKTQLKQIIAEELENMDLDEGKWTDKLRKKFGSKDYRGIFDDAVGADSEDPIAPAAAGLSDKMGILAPQLAQVDDPGEIRHALGDFFTAMVALNQNDLTIPELRRVGLELIKMGRRLQTAQEKAQPEPISPEQAAKEEQELLAQRASRSRYASARHGGGGVGSQITGPGATPGRQPAVRENKKKRRVKRRK